MVLELHYYLEIEFIQVAHHREAYKMGQELEHQLIQIQLIILEQI
jgi:hypothetical protein